MAMLCASSSVVFSSSSSTSSSTPKLSFPSLKTLNKASSSSASLFVGFPVGRLNASVKTTLPVNTKWAFQFRCQDLSVVTDNQWWMFEESEVNGPDIWNNIWYPKAADHRRSDKTQCVVDATAVDMGAYVIVVTAEKVVVSVKKRTQKLYRRHSGRPGGMKVETFDQLQQRIPERIIEHAVCGMLPTGDLVEHCSPI